MFKYQCWYDALIKRARGRALDCYKETHHILPRSMGGTDDGANLVDLTYREHFLAHWLLTKITDGNARRKMISALNCMIMPLNGRAVSGWQYEIVKRALKDATIKNFYRRLEERKRLIKRLKRQRNRVILKEIIAAEDALDYNWNYLKSTGEFGWPNHKNRAKLKKVADIILRGARQV